MGEMNLYEVRQGRIQVNRVDVVVRHDDVWVLEVDLASKYPDFVSYFSSGDQLGVTVHAGDATLYLDEAADHDTEIVFRPGGGRWDLVADGSRYTVRIALYRHTAADAGDARAEGGEPLR
ncbi:MAG: hypothetical protein ACRDT2_13735 [Natronosporangium sp.]